MPPINVFTNSAINPEKASGVTPQTAGDSGQLGGVPSNPPPATTTYEASPASYPAPYPAAQPGASAMPAPTGAAQRYAPQTAQPTPTTTSQPPPPGPQPGAFPVPSNRIPPPPKAGEAMPNIPTPQYYPPQMHMPPPTTTHAGQPPASSTSTTTNTSSAYPVPLQANYDGPPGYQQNPYAVDLTPDQRRAQEASSSLGGYGGNESTGDMSSLAADAQNMWDTAKQWAAKAGEKLSEAENEVWKRVNK